MRASPPGVAPPGAAPPGVAPPGAAPLGAAPLGALRSALATLLAVGRRPALWPTAIGQARRMAPDGWWRRAPFLPLPPADYLRFRMETQYGDADHRPEPSDVVAYLAWCRHYRRTTTP